MSRKQYSTAFARELAADIESAGLRVPMRPARYEDGDTLVFDVQGVWPTGKARARFLIEKFVGGGFAGQVYRCRLEALEPGEGPAIAGLRVGGVYGVKLLIPPGRFARRFRDAVYRMAFQAPFSAQVLECACRAGLLWQKVIRLAAQAEWGTPEAVADVYAWCFDPAIGAYGEIREWVEGRMWRLEADARLSRRRCWRTVRPEDTGSPEYVAKRQFMARFVRLLHALGAPELARQYEWWTLKSQPNLMKRFGHEHDPSAGLCAFDFRAGLALLPFLPMSPMDPLLIWRGLRRGALVQFDRGDTASLRRFAAAHPDVFAGQDGLLDALETSERAYRRSMPDMSRQGLRLLGDPALRSDVRAGLVAGYRCHDLVDTTFARRLERGGLRFAAFWLLGAIPLAGRLLRRVWGHAGYRTHVSALVRDPVYRRRFFRAGIAGRLIAWVRAGRVGESCARFLLEHPLCFWLRRLTLGFLPPSLHRSLAEPTWARQRFAAAWAFLRSFFRDPDFREQWLTGQVEDGYRGGMLSDSERDQIMAHVRDPFIVKYLASLGVHFATLPVTQIVSLITAVVVVVWQLSKGAEWSTAAAYFGGVLIFFQVLPISPGSLCRGCYVVYLMVRDRKVRDYLLAAPLSFVKYIGYFAFPLQMVAAYPALARFMGSRWAIHAVSVVPIFGEHGAWLEHAVFDLFFNLPRELGARISRHARWVLTGWMAAGVGLFALVVRLVNLKLPGFLNLCIAVVVLFILPRLVFYPVLSRGTDTESIHGL